jgi:hypothetical protein
LFCPLFFNSLWIQTMNRCLKILLLALALTAGSVQSQGIVREAPKDVKSGRIVVTAPPEITLNGKADRLSPGARIRSLNNMLLLSGSLVGQNLPVVYRRDAAGLVHEVWILSAEEYSRLGGGDDGNPEGYKRFAELLDLIFGARR